MNNKKRIFVGVIILLFLGLFITFAGGDDNELILKNVEFIDGFNDSLISSQEIQAGKSAVVPENPVHDDYVFVGWYLFDNRDIRVTEFDNILENLKVVALYSIDKNNNGIADENDNSYTVTFVDGVLNTIINTQTILSGMDAVVPNASEHEGYVFTGWSDGYTNITKDMSIISEYVKEDIINNHENENIILYNVTFVDGDTRAVLKTQIVQEGNAAGLPVVPEHEKRVFKEWNGDYKNIRSNRTITAVYVDDLNDDGINDEIQPHFLINYYDYDGSLIKNENVLINMPTPSVDDPIRLNYKFEGWTPVVSELVNESVDYVATYSPLVDINRNRMADIDEIKFTVNYAVDGNIVKSYSNLLYGTKTPIYDSVPLKSGYYFDGWGEIAEVVSEDVTYNASFFVDVNCNKISDDIEDKYVIRYLDEYNMEIKSYPNLLVNTKTPILDIELNPVKEGYIFDGWNNFSDIVSKSVDYKAKWLSDSDKDGIADIDEFEIKFTVEDEIISTQYLKENEIPVIPVLTKEKYVLSDWSPNVSKAVENQIYVASWLDDINSDGYADINQFKITFKALDRVLINDYYNLDDKMPIPSEKDIPVKNGYVFVGWGEDVSKTVSETKEYNAVYELDINDNKIADLIEEKVEIKYLNKDGSVFESFSELVNTKTPFPKTNPVTEGYIFAGWISVTEKVSADVSYVGNWLVDSDRDGTADIDEFEIKFTVEDEIISTQYLKENEMPVIPILTKEKFVLSDWSPNVSKAVINQTYIASWLDDINSDGYADVNQFKITFKALDRVLVNNYYNFGDKMPIPSEGDVPAKYGYVFVGWGEDVSKTVSETKEYNAVYELDINDNKIADSIEEKYVVRYLDYDGELIKEYNDLLLNTKTPILEKNPIKKGHVFVGWEDYSEVVLENKNYKSEWLIDSDNDGYADENQFDVKFYIDNELVSVQYVNENELPVVPTLNKDGWTLSEFTPEVIANKSNLYYANWIDTIDPELNINYVLSEDSSKSKIIINATDKGSGIKSIKYSFEDNLNKVDVDREFDVTLNGKYIIYVEDNSGNIISKSIDVSGIEIFPSKDKNFKDEYIKVSFGEVEGLFVNYNLDMQIETNEGFKIKSIKYYQSDVGLFGGLYDLFTSSSSGKYLTEEEMKSNDYSLKNIELPHDCVKYDLKLYSDSADKFTILVEFDYKGDSVYELYKIRLAQFVK